MSNSNRAIAELVSRRTELLRQRRQLLTETRAIGRELAAVRRELGVLVPRRSTEFRHLIRRAIKERSMLTTELTLMVLRERGLGASDKPVYLLTRKRVHACLKEMRRDGKVVSLRVPGKPNAWTLSRR